MAWACATRRTWVWIPLLGALTLSATGDTVELKTGEHLEGAFRQPTTSSITIAVAGQPLATPLEKVRAIYFGAGAVAAGGPAPRQEALDALKALQSVTQSGISYRDYAPRVLDAKVKVDHYVASPVTDQPEVR